MFVLMVASFLTVPGGMSPLAAAAEASTPQAGAERNYDIAAGPLGPVLNQIANQNDLTLVYDSTLVQGLETQGLSGSYSRDEALARVLKGSGLEYKVSGRTFTLEKKKYRGHTQLNLEPAEDEATPDLMAQNNETTQKKETSGEKAGKKSIKMKPVKVIADKQKIVQGLTSYVVDEASASTKTNTPLIETPQSISIVTRKQMDDQNAIFIGEALRYTPGLQSQTFGADSRFLWFNMRGFDATTTGLFQDGLQLRAPSFVVSYNPEPYGMERIEVPRGPASVLYGQGNPGGLVNFVSKRPMVKETFHELIFQPGSFNFQQGSFDFNDSIDQKGEFTYRLTGVVRESGTMQDFVPNDRVFIAPSLTWQPNSDTTLTILSNYQYDVFGEFQWLPTEGTLLPNPNGVVPTDRFLGEPAFDRQDRTFYSLGYIFDHRFDNTWSVRQKVRLNHTDRNTRGVSGFTLRPDMRTWERFAYLNDNSLDAISVDNQLHAKFTTGPVQHTVLVGLDYQHIDIGRKGNSWDTSPIDVFNPSYSDGPPPLTGPFPTGSEIMQNQTGLYFQEQAKVFDRLILQFGGRHDWASNNVFNTVRGTTIDEDDNKFTYRGGAVYRSEYGLAPYFSYARSFNPVGGTNFFGDPFKPETGEQFEAGLKYQPPGWDSFLTFAWFDLTRQNVVQPDPNNPLNQIQTGEMNSTGIELEAVSNFEFGLSLIATYTNFDIEITQTTIPTELNMMPANVADEMASFWADYTQPDGFFKGLGIGGGVRYTGPTFATNENLLQVDGITLGDAAIHYTKGGFRVAFNIQNVTDEKFVASCFGACSYGDRRTMRGTVAYRW